MVDAGDEEVIAGDEAEVSSTLSDPRLIVARWLIDPIRPCRTPGSWRFPRRHAWSGPGLRWRSWR